MLMTYSPQQVFPQLSFQKADRLTTLLLFTLASKGCLCVLTAHVSSESNLQLARGRVEKLRVDVRGHLCCTGLQGKLTLPFV